MSSSSSQSGYTAGTVKWFKPEKGYGFVGVQGGPDIFLHVKELEKIGLSTIAEGTPIWFESEPDPKKNSGKICCTKILLTSPEEAPEPKPQSQDSAPKPEPQESGPKRMLFKWLHPSGRFGFLECPNGGSELFFHISVLERAGLTGLAEGQAVMATSEPSTKGKKGSLQAATITPCEA